MRLALMAVLALAACAAAVNPSNEPTTFERMMIEREHTDPAVRARIAAAADEGRRQHMASLEAPPPAQSAAVEQSRREAYCRSLSADIAMAGSSGADIIVRGLLGVPLERQRSLYHSCMLGFARTDAYLSR